MYRCNEDCHIEKHIQICVGFVINLEHVLLQHLVICGRIMFIMFVSPSKLATEYNIPRFPLYFSVNSAELKL